jgi:type III restriction enzyme
VVINGAKASLRRPLPTGVEYKGKHLYDAADAEEKRMIGKVWGSRSAGKCLFEMPTEGDFSGIARAVKQG